MIPAAISLASVVTLGTIFILIFFPVRIILLNDFSVYFKYLLTGKKPEREDVEVAIKDYRRKLKYEEMVTNKYKKREALPPFFLSYNLKIRIYI
jgi:hypothetical protein